ncbi:MAG TPA: CPBP family intramembrane glutamic endopeptidase [Bryobacterales bacterium]|nr:CPBP family intramembrane glutamic endopeptidase [Bryobacterales bacterium]
MQSRSSPGPNLVPQHQGLVPLYVSLIVLEWALVRYVWAGVRKQGGGLFELIGGRWSTAKTALLDFAIALPFWVVWEATARLVHALLGRSEAKSIDVLLPKGATEVALWFALSASAGVCEEIVFRGYFQKQFRALTGSVAAAVLLQAIVFGAAHAYQGLKQVSVITVLGVLYGLLAEWCRTLRPGMLAHAWSDIYGGYLKFL